MLVAQGLHHPPMPAARRFLPALLTIALSPIAHASAATAPQAPKRADRPTLIDTVVATVNDNAILWSELRSAVTGRVNTEIAQAGGITPQRERAIQREVLNELINQRRMGQAAKTFGATTPEQVESMVQSMMDRDRQEMVRDLGTQTAVSRELQRTGRTWQTKQAELRQQKLAEIAESIAVYSRLSQQSNLHLTPLMLRQTYARHRDLFVHPPQAQVSQVLFRGAEAESRAREAAEIWRRQGLSARELANRFPDTLVLDDLLATQLTGDLRDFALQGPQGQVRDPVAVPAGFQVAKVVQFAGARNGRFEDPEVQEQLRELCRRQVVLEFRQQALELARDRTEVWVSPYFR